MPTTPPPTTQEPGAARRVAANALNPFAAQVATKALMLGYGIMQYRLIGGGAAGLGDYFLAALALLYVGTVADWGLGTLLTREVAKNRGSTEEEEHTARLFRQTLALRLAISVALFLPVGLFIAMYMALFNLSVEGAWAMLILALSLIPSAFSGSVTALLYAHERMSLPAVVGVSTSVVNVALGAGALLLGWGITGMAAAASATTLVTAAVLWRILRRDYPGLHALDGSALRVGWGEALPLLKTGWPLMLNALLVNLFFRVDQFIIKANAGRQSGSAADPQAEEARSALEVERYQAAYSFLNFVLLITPAVTLALFPRMSRHAAGDRPRLVFEYTFALKVLAILSAPIIVLTVWFAPLLITVMTGGTEQYLPQSAVVLQILIFFLPFSFINGVTQYVLIALDRQSLITRAFGATAAFNVLANLALVPWLGINGAALSTVLSELVLLVPFMVWTRRELGDLSLGAIITKPLIGGLVAGALGWALQGLAQGWSNSPADMAAYFGGGLLLLVAYAVAMFLARPFTESENAALRGAFRRK